ncbi:MAG: ATP-binding cassette domain-containing protein [Methanomicrobiales archaeon]|nr:ATP-binding cassette domain-containing protein [Methanomicrobiales archaeon]
MIAVQDVSAEVEKGEIFGLLGPNGAGKTTLIRILTTLIRPTSGHAFVGSYEVTKEPEKVRSIIGVCPQTGTLDPELTAWENLDFYGKLLGMEDHYRRKRIPELLAMIGLQNRAHFLVQTFSGGMKRKLEIVRAFIHRPLILFLDEPTIGLDPESRREVWEQVRTLKGEGTTIILTTHYMDEAEHLCDRVALMDMGKLIVLDTPDNLKKAMPEGDLIEMRTESVTEDLLTGVRSLSHVLNVQGSGNLVRISARDGSGTLPEIISVFEKNKKRIAAISIHSPSLEDVFIHFTGRRLSESSEGAVPQGGGQP